MAIFGGDKEEDLPDEPDINERIELGDRVRDTVTGFEGIVTGRTEYLNGCVQWHIERMHPTENKPQSFMFDDQQVEVIEKKSFKRQDVAPQQRKEKQPAKVGGPSKVAPTMH